MNRLREKLWFRPLIFLYAFHLTNCTSIDSTRLHELVPEINTESLETLLHTISSSMLVIAIFAVGSMISLFGSQ
jgi:hypothetical protein